MGDGDDMQNRLEQRCLREALMGPLPSPNETISSRPVRLYAFQRALARFASPNDLRPVRIPGAFHPAEGLFTGRFHFPAHFLYLKTSQAFFSAPERLTCIIQYLKWIDKFQFIYPFLNTKLCR